MKRRDVLKMLASAAVLPSLSPEAFSLLREVHAQIAENPGLKTLNPHQNATVTTVAEMIIPQTSTPGAKAAKVNEFIDVILTDWYDEPDTARFLAGLADVDRRSRHLFGKNFIDCSEDQRTQLLTVLDREGVAAANRIKARESKLGVKNTNPLAFENFFYAMKKLTLIGYYTSEMGFEDELHEFVIPPDHAGCAPVPPDWKA